MLVVVENGASALYAQGMINSDYLSQYSVTVGAQFCEVLRFSKLVSQDDLMIKMCLHGTYVCLKGWYRHKRLCEI